MEIKKSDLKSLIGESSLPKSREASGGQKALSAKKAKKTKRSKVPREKSKLSVEALLGDETTDNQLETLTDFLKFGMGIKGDPEKVKTPRSADEPEKTGPQLELAAFLDGTEECLEPALVNRLDDLEKLKSKTGDRAQMSAVVYRSGVPPQKTLKKGALKTAAHVLIPAAGSVVAGPLGFAAGMAVDAVLFYRGHTLRGVQQIYWGLHHDKALKEPSWGGKRVYQITPDQTEGFDSKLIKREDGVKETSAGDLTKLLVANLGKNPKARRVLYITGHGLGFRSAAGLTVKDMAEAMEKAEQKGAARPDIIMMESCLEGNLETLSLLKDRAGYALLSEETLLAEKLPVKQMLAETVSDKADNGAVARSMMKAMKFYSPSDDIPTPTMAAYDLSRVDGTLRSMDKLAASLLKEIGRGKEKEVKEALQQTRRFAVSPLTPRSNRKIHFSDLGDFLDHLAEKNFSPQTKKDLIQARKALQRLVIVQQNSKRYQGVSGVSFLSKDNVHKEGFGEYQDTPLPENWKNLINFLDKGGEIPRPLAVEPEPEADSGNKPEQQASQIGGMTWETLPTQISGAPSSAASSPIALEIDGHKLTREDLLSGRLADKKTEFIDVSVRDLRGTDFSQADLKGVSFGGSDIRGCKFDEAELEMAIFCDSKNEGASFKRARMAGTLFNDSVVRGVDFREAKMDAVGWDTDFSGSDFRQADMREGKFRGSIFKDADFRGANLHKGSFSESDFTDAKMAGADLSWADLEGCKFDGVDLKEVKLTGAKIKGADFSKAINVPLSLKARSKMSNLRSKD